MPDRIEPTVTTPSDFADELQRLLQESVRRLDQSDKNTLAVSLHQSRQCLGELATMAEGDARRHQLLRQLKGERTLIEAMLWAEARERTNALTEGVINASVDLLISGAVRAVTAI